MRPRYARLKSLVIVFIVHFAFDFRTTAAAQVTPQPVTDFDNSVAFYPSTGVIKGSDGAFYGTTSDSLNTRCGTVYKLLADGTPPTVLREFQGRAATPPDGCLPNGELVDGGDGYLYGTTVGGGSKTDATLLTGTGTIFRVSKDGDAVGYDILYEFAAYDPSVSYWRDGTTPRGGLTIGLDGNLYGTTSWGGQYAGGTNCNGGTIFRLTPPRSFVVIHEMNFAEGCNPNGNLRLASDGNFLGAALSGGGQDARPSCCGGTIFKVTPAGVLTRLFLFYGTIASGTPYGYRPNDAPVEASDGSLYGTTSDGGPAGDTTAGAGSVYKLSPAGSEYTAVWIHGFGPDNAAVDGANPVAGLAFAPDGNLYGVTAFGGDHTGGTLFKITPAGAFKKLYSFTGQADGGFPKARLLEGPSGTFYGTTFGGGSSSRPGVVFRFTVASPTTTGFQASPSTGVFGQDVTLTANVSSASGSPTGQVEFFDGPSSLGRSELNNDLATLVTTTLSVGTHSTLSARYLGGEGFLASMSPNASVTIGRAATTTTLASSPNPSARKQVVTLTATVTALAPGAGTAAGQVQFLDGKKKLGTAPVVNGVATLQVTFASMGGHDLTATYGGDANFVGSSAVFTLTVNR